MRFSKAILIFSALLPLILSTAARVNGDTQDFDHRFRLSSSTFQKNATFPLSMIATFPSAANPNLNACTVDGSNGGDQSPELSWTGAPDGTRSFVVVMFDVTASFTHWGMYNISGDKTGLPASAGVANSNFGNQVSNDFGNVNYDGPCPPTNLSPQVHQYVFTVYALDTKLPVLPSSGNFPPGSEALYHALIAAARQGHILDTASLSGMYSAAAPAGPPSD